ncbi:PREDICTED: VIN3-like protein 1 [Tarenaya hassleriana]|uniref:VIN3-like protein 1 n=1 Tax=Tarenaya hassleriana TaxID=28532 RepID=UPI00053C574C|nr:PREDICTED: VIN3-like protein 1 [Tarenaya hassleriana]
MIENLKKSNKVVKKQAIKGYPGANPQPLCKKPTNKNRSRKINNPKQLRELPQDSRFPNKPWICKNYACRKFLSASEKFCKRCSCCICGKFDDNKDTGKWLECKYQSGDNERDKCNHSCHVECALEKHDVGVVYHGPSMQLDGGYRCCFCGTVSGILDFWKKRLVIAKHTKCLDTLSYNINLSCRLLDGTFKFKDLHTIVNDAKAKLESEIGPTDMDSAGTLRGLVGRLSVAEHVRNLCSLAIEKADQFYPFDAYPLTRARACNFVCDEVTLSSVQITVLGTFSAMAPDGLKGYKLWHHKTKDEIRPEEPTHLIPTTPKPVTISGLKPATKYTFCVAAYCETGDWGHSETSCVTKGGDDELLEIYQNHMDFERESLSDKELNNGTGNSSSGHRVRNLGISLRLAGADKLGSSSSRGLICAVDMEEEWNGDMPGNSGRHDLLSGHRGLDLNLTMVPDLNEEVVPPYDSSKDGEVNGSGEIHGNGENTRRSNEQQGFLIHTGNGTTHHSLIKTGNSKEDTHESNSTLSNIREPLSPPREDLNGGGIEQNLEHCIKTIRRLECEGHISSEFRLKLLTWFCVRSTQYQRRIVHLFIDAFVEDPDQLARQLIHSFPDIDSSKRPRNGCSTGES